MNSPYALLTAVHNEQEHIARVIKCVCAQTILPKVWAIVDTGSSDGTRRIIRESARDNSFIQFSHLESTSKRDFAAKVRGLQQGCELVRAADPKYIGVLDADVSFAPDYYERIIARLNDSRRAGIAGGICIDLDQVGQKVSGNGHVRGAIQTFRRECLEDIGGLLPLTAGGEDTAAEIMARMKGWTVRCYADLQVIHHRRTAAGGSNIWKGRFRQGSCDYNLGYHPLFFFAKCARRVFEKPYLLGSLLRFTGYGWSAVAARDRRVPREVVQFLRKEQVERLSEFVFYRRER